MTESSESIYVITTKQVLSALSAVDVHKAPGPDGLPNWLLKEGAGALSAPVAAIFNSSLRQGPQGYVPEIWKSANVTLIPKNTSPKCLQKDLRPISVTSTIGKLLEGFIGSFLTDQIADQIELFKEINNSCTNHDSSTVVKRD